MPDIKPHATLILTVKTDFIKGKENISMEMSGCKAHLQDAFTELLLEDQQFKEFVNRSIRAANEQRAREQN